jgi:outer membrane protein OmpA-like peptidoglycan-associated protein
MKTRISLTALAVSLWLLGGCSTGLDRSREEALNQSAGIEVTQTKSGVQVRLPDRVLFDFDQAALRPDSGVAINRAVVLIRRSHKPVLVEGHTDNVGTHEYNQQLSEARAQVVAQALEARGVKPTRVTVRGFAFDRPVADNDSPEGRARNRRTEIVIEGETVDSVLGRPRG